MTLRETIFNDLTAAQKSGNVDVVSTLRLLASAMYNKEIEKRAKVAGDLAKAFLEEGEIHCLVQTEIKRRKDAIALYLQGKREDLAKKEQKEIEILSRYAPQALSDDEVYKEAKRVVEELQVKSAQDFGKVMGTVMSRLKGRADGSVVQTIVKELLAKTS